MSSVDWTRVPVVVGAGQLTVRETDPLAAPDPLAAMEQVAELAAADLGGSATLRRLTHCWTVHSLSLRHSDPAGDLARRLGAQHAQARCSGMGGNVPQWLINRAADLVAAGSQPLVLVVGAEMLATRRQAKRAGIRLPWPGDGGWPQTWPPLEPDLGVHPVERAHGLDQATSMYALVESALAAAAGHDPAAHLRAVADLMARANAVAAVNPYSWFPVRRSAQELVTVGTDNRMVCHPYPKYLNAVMDVDMAAAVLVTDAATAFRLGAGPDAVAYLAGWADATDIWYLSQRPLLHRSPALAQCLAAALGAGHLGLEDVTGFDLYACFPSSVEVARDSFGIPADDPRPLTLTGALPYHGGPGSNYVTHAVANTLDQLRQGAQHAVIVHGNGYYLTKHAVGLYTRQPPSEPPVPPEGLQERVDAAASALAVDPSPAGPGTVVAWTAPYDRDGTPQAALAVVEVDGRRTVARADRELSTALLTDTAGAHGTGVGTAVHVEPTPEGNRISAR